MGVFKPLSGCMLLLALLAAQTQAAIITPTSVTASSEFAAAGNLINGSGLSGVGAVETQLHDNNENNMWQTFAASAVGETAIFTLDQNYDLSSALLWQYNGLNGFGLEELDRELDEISLAVDDNLVGPFTSIGNLNLAPALDQTAVGFNEPAQVFALAGASNVRRVQLTIVSVQGGVDDGTAGLSEVRFAGTVTVPEPTTFALAAVGLLSVPWLTRRKRT